VRGGKKGGSGPLGAAQAPARESRPSARRLPGKKVSILFFSFSFFSLFTCLQTIPNKISKPNQNKINLLHNRK
jgi:hypothetical protein